MIASLCIPEQVQFKIAVLTYKVLHGLVPQYFGPLNPVTELSVHLCSASAIVAAYMSGGLVV